MEYFQIAYIIGRQMTSAGMYFNQISMYIQLKPYPDPKVQQNINRLEKHLENLSAQFQQQIQYVNHTVQGLDIEPPPPPSIPPEYTTWANTIHQSMIDRLQPDPLCTNIYLFGLCIGEILTSITTICFLLEFHKTLELPYKKQLAQCTTELEVSMQKWTSVVNAFHAEERFGPFSDFWMKIHGQIEMLLHLFGINTENAKQGREIATNIETAEQNLLLATHTADTLVER